MMQEWVIEMNTGEQLTLQGARVLHDRREGRALVFDDDDRLVGRFPEVRSCRLRKQVFPIKHIDHFAEESLRKWCWARERDALWHDAVLAEVNWRAIRGWMRFKEWIWDAYLCGGVLRGIRRFPRYFR